jgi:hypothetical protein
MPRPQNLEPARMIAENDKDKEVKKAQKMLLVHRLPRALFFKVRQHLNFKYLKKFKKT